MPAPATTDDFLEVVEKSRLVGPDDLDTYRFRAAADPAPPHLVASRMVKDGLLTPFQAELLLAGKSRPFFVGPYKVLSRIGNGSMGVVYLCEHVDMRRQVAVKVLQSRRVKDEVAFQRFLREARAAASLNHPNVVHALDLGSEGDLHYLSMEYVDGSSLKDLIRTEGPLPPRRLADYLRQAALGLQHAHAAGLIHRDIKPSNVMVDRAGVVKVLDLGLALFADGEMDLTLGVRLGSVAYMAPEQAKDSHAVDARADVYSLGATFYLAATGRQPLPAAGIGDNTPPPRCLETADFVRLVAILEKMTARDPADRYQSAAEVAAAVAAWVPPPPPPPRMPAATPAPPAPVEQPTPLPAKQDLALEAPPLRVGPEVRQAGRAAQDVPAESWLARWRLPLIFGAAALAGLLLALATR
jgi:serine/threonine protein kinase